MQLKLSLFIAALAVTTTAMPIKTPAVAAITPTIAAEHKRAPTTNKEPMFHSKYRVKERGEPLSGTKGFIEKTWSSWTGDKSKKSGKSDKSDKKDN